MIIELKRKTIETKSGEVFGELLIDCKHQCFTLEKFTVMIPAGSYPLTVNKSNRFNKRMPLLTVKGRSGIRIHSGNTTKDTSGCILVGKEKNNDNKGFDGMLHSRDAFNELMEILEKEISKNSAMVITVTNPM